MSGSPAPSRLPSALLCCPLPPGNHFFRAPASPASPTPGASPRSEAMVGPVLPTWSPCSPSQASLRRLPLWSLVAPPTQPTQRISGDLPAPLHLCSPEAWLGWTRAAGLQGAGLELSPRLLEPLVSIYGGDLPHATLTGWAS